jgi:hypothetical protein
MLRSMNFLRQTSDWITPGIPQRIDHKKLCDDLYFTGGNKSRQKKKAITT